MIKLKIFLSSMALCAMGLCFHSCESGNDLVADVPQPSDPSDENIVVDEITVSFANAYGNGGQLEDLMTSTSFPVGGKIFISQLGSNVSPAFPLTYGPSTPNFYVYEHYENDDADWDGGYNFSLSPDSSPIEWDVIKSYGSVGNSFGLYALYFPQGSIALNVNANFPNVYAVSEWQNNMTVESMNYYDVLGAYHSFSSLWSRLRFRMFHLMTYVRVTLYLPVLETKDGKTTGFDDNAFHTSRHQTVYEIRNYIPGSFLGISSEHGGNNYRNLSRFWRIDYNANRTSDREGPLVETIKLTDQSFGSPRANICMYPHNDKDDDSPDAGFEETTIRVADFYKGGDREYDRVRKYEFSAIFPPQTITGELLYFHIKTPGTPDGIFTPSNSSTAEAEAAIKRYYFSTNQLLSGKNDIAFTSGTMNHISLYVPRTENKTVLVSADVIPWTEAFTDMTIIDEDAEDANK